MLATTGSGELTEWIAEFVIREQDEQAAITAAREGTSGG